MGVNTQQNDYFEGLFKRTTASYRAKIDKENDRTSKTLPSEKSACSRQARNKNVKVLCDRNHLETSSSFHSASENRSKSLNEQHQRNNSVTSGNADFNIGIIKDIIEKKLSQVLRDKFSPWHTKSCMSEEKTAIKSIVEEVLKEKLSDLLHPKKEKISTSEPGSLRSIIEDVVEQILIAKLTNLENRHTIDSTEKIEKDLQQKLNIDLKAQKTQQCQPLAERSVNRSFDSQALVEELLDSIEAKKKNENIKTKSNTKTSNEPVEGIKRLQRSPKRKPQWQDPSLHDNVLVNHKKPQHSPMPSSTTHSQRSKSSSSVLSKFKIYKKKNFFNLYVSQRYSSAFNIAGA